MKAKIASLWETVSVSFWFMPGLLVLGCMGLAHLTVYLDQEMFFFSASFNPWLYAGDTDGARTFLTAVGASVITVAGVTFSITMVALTITSSQYGPRLLRNFMKDRPNQIVLGSFIGTFVYCLLVSNAVGAISAEGKVPKLAVSVGILLTIIDLGLLVYFLHHMAASIQATSIVDRAYQDLLSAIDRMLPKGKVSSLPAELQPDAAPKLRNDSPTIPAVLDGYLKAINEEGLMDLAVEHDLVIQSRYRPGDFIFSRTILVCYFPQRDFDFDFEKAVRKCFIVGVQRTPLQDIEFSITQLVEVALRALSPGINDAFTAMNCLDRLGEAVSVIAARPFPQSLRCDSDGRPRLIMDVTSFEGVMNAAFHQIRQNATTKPDVSIRLLEVLGTVAPTLETGEQREAVRRHADMTHRAISREIVEPEDQRDIDDRYQAVLNALAGHEDTSVS